MEKRELAWSRKEILLLVDEEHQRNHVRTETMSYQHFPCHRSYFNNPLQKVIVKTISDSHYSRTTFIASH